MCKLNKGELKWFLVLVTFSLYIFNLIQSKKMYYFVHPRIIKYIKILLIFLIILSIIQFIKIFTEKHERKISLLIFILPIISGFLVNPQSSNLSIIPNKGVDIAQNSSTFSKAKAQVNVTTDNNKMILVDDSNFTKIMNDMIYNKPEKYKGRKISITGFIYKDNSTLKNEFVIARLMMVCCAADAEVTGILCSFDKSSSLPNGNWFTITGTIDTMLGKVDGKDRATPIIRVEDAKASSKPKNPYIYPE